MTWNGNGVVNPPNSPEFPAVAGDLIRASYFNLVVQEIIDNFLNAAPRDGQAPLTGNMNFASLYRPVNLPAAVANGQAVRFNEFSALQTAVAGLANTIEPFILMNAGIE